MEPIRIALIGVGNCASSLVQGIHYYRTDPDTKAGLMHATIGGYGPDDIQVVAVSSCASGAPWVVLVKKL